jgi:hypothetical protein
VEDHHRKGPPGQPRCGGGAQGLHCKKIICSRVFFVKREMLSVDRRSPGLEC